MVRYPEHVWHEADPSWPWPADPALDDGVRDRPVLETLAATVARHGSVVALEDSEHRLTFDALWHEIAVLVTQLAGSLGPVGILLPPGPAYSVALFACLAANRPAILLDPAWPALRTSQILDGAGVALLILSPGAASIGNIQSVVVWPEPASSRPGADLRLLRPLPVDAPAIILCTSGSTGRPKAIVHSQHTMMGKAWAQMNSCGVKAGADLCLSLAPPATLGGALAMLSCAVAGVGLRFLDLRRDGISGLIESLTQRPVTLLRAAPSALRLITALPDATRILHGMRSVTLVSEPVLRGDIAVLRACIPPDAVIYTSYGSTESGSIAWYPSATDTHDQFRAPAGRLTPGTAALILDENGAPCAPDEPGELVLRSPYNALGEWHGGACRPGPFASDPTDPTRRIHHTGDIARCTEDGVYIILGRQDRMLKLNGQRIEPGEIEAALRACDGVADAAVVSPNGRTLLAFVALHSGTTPDAVRASLRTRLPASMIPSRIMPLDVLPQLPGGKVDLVRLTTLAKRGIAA